MAQPVAEFVGLGKDGKLVDIALLLDVSSKYCRRVEDFDLHKAFYSTISGKHVLITPGVQSRRRVASIASTELESSTPGELLNKHF